MQQTPFERPARTLPGLTRPVPVDPSGIAGPTRGQAAGPHWRQSTRGFYVPAGVDGSVPGQRAIEQSVRLTPGGALTGWASLHLQGASYLDGLLPDGRTPIPVPLAIGSGNIRRSSEVRLLRDPLAPEDVLVCHGVRCTAGERATFDAARTASSLVEAVVVIDMACEGEVTSLARLRRYAEQRRRWRGGPLVLQALAFASERSWSPNEPRVRMIWERDLGLPRPLVNVPLFDRQGRLLGYPDLLDEESGLVIEYDGAEHRRAVRHARDVGREDTFRRHHLEVTRVTGPDLGREGLVDSRLLAARKRARWLPPDSRAWTTAAPPGWVDDPTLDAQLDYRDFMREVRATWDSA